MFLWAHTWKMLFGARTQIGALHWYMMRSPIPEEHVSGVCPKEDFMGTSKIFGYVPEHLRVCARKHLIDMWPKRHLPT